jgi:hypothetical protein
MAMAISKPKPKTAFDRKLPLTRKWVDDYRRWIREGCPTPEQKTARAQAPAGSDPPPDLQELVKRAGGYHRITAEQWAEFDRQMAEWQARRRARVQKL